MTGTEQRKDRPADSTREVHAALDELLTESQQSRVTGRATLELILCDGGVSQIETTMKKTRRRR